MVLGWIYGSEGWGFESLRAHTERAGQGPDGDSDRAPRALDAAKMLPRGSITLDETPQQGLRTSCYGSERWGSSSPRAHHIAGEGESAGDRRVPRWVLDRSLV